MSQKKTRMNSQFTIRNLLVLIAIFSIASWMLTINWHYAVIWMGVIFGIYVARRSGYPVILLAICGLLMATLVIMALTGLNAIASGSFPFATSLAESGQMLSNNARVLILVFDAILWGAAIIIFSWFISVLKRAQSAATRPESNGIDANRPPNR